MNLKSGIPILLIFIIGIFSFSITNAQVDSSHFNFQSFMNVTYKVRGADSLKLDVFLPAVAKERKVPLVVVVHGGGWAFGNKDMDTITYMRKLKQGLLQNGFAVASISYSLVSKEVHLPTPIEDCKDAVRWLYAHAEEYNFDTHNYGIWGGSAGAHLALLIAYSDKETFQGDSLLKAYPSHLNYVIDNFGPTDLNELFKVDLGGVSTLMFKVFIRKIYDIRQKLTFAITGYQFDENKTLVKETNALYSPLNFVEKGAVPTLILHGTKDRIVSVRQSEQLKQQLDKCAVPNNLILVEDGDHGFNKISSDKMDELIGLSIEFAKKQTK
ncbi:alpha/beta hydrolase fold domain-containing protein [Sphingobacterium sp. LRF_L2]|uniref:alpha/beta hydrolase fold domain-containing protein n=1 Tax=Sphingobacterium sp. LRF_L2 TaxID=3369421 RepID=UPI003F648CA3